MSELSSVVVSGLAGGRGRRRLGSSITGAWIWEPELAGANVSGFAPGVNTAFLHA
jgi:hypothetical protein